ncbi:methyl-accepting chemotaxis protein [Alteromonas australica]|jgi:methyl-accepting chemotaxis protein|uniref:methyl-accepting chemotaxis protein n=1 Tax=Alteromonas australica TaxID=589873 RepID=UPI000C56EA68|nr:methyl-accepting chemotaxis protein [Alteromonas australica]MAF71813.1 methyl-accepting chemotaxis protein [Alteromonas sp.]|tara:strand:- start:5780 stop:7786 length:2007 start_codon:yes stop_codon:yes gene_type:complete
MQLTVVNKIKLGFGLFGCLLLLTSILSYVGLSDIRHSADDVVERKMPVQTQMVKVKTDILSLSVITANGFHEATPSLLAENEKEFSSLSVLFVEDLNALSQSLSNTPLVNDAVQASNLYVENSKQMYQALASRMSTEIALEAKLEEVLRAADEASALMLDLSYLESNDPVVETLIGAGTAIDNKLLTMNDTFSELTENTDSQATQNIIDDLSYQISNLQVDKEYINRLAADVDDGGTVDAFNSQFDSLLTLLNSRDGLIALQKQKLSFIDIAFAKRSAAIDALNQALEKINALFEKVQAEAIAGQRAIADTVEINILKNVVVAIIGLFGAIALAVVSTRSISRPLGRINRGLSQLSKGDLSHKLPENGSDEFAALSAKVNSLTDGLRALVGNILEQEKRLIEITKDSVALGEKSLTEVNAQREHVTATSTNTQHVQDTSRSNLAQITQAMESLHRVSEQSGDIGKLVDENKRQVLHQAKLAEASAKTINRLDENSRNIGSILDVIKTIAEQTNLLALNAAIEAARAGEQGRGFAVVADEVRTLANRTHDSTEEIEAMIRNLQKDASEAVTAIRDGREQAREGVEITEQVASQMAEIREIIAGLHDINEHIVADTQQQDVLLADVAQSLNTIVSLADSSATSTRQANESTMLLDAQTESLRKAVERFQL